MQKVFFWMQRMQDAGLRPPMLPVLDTRLVTVFLDLGKKRRLVVLRLVGIGA